MAKGKKKNPGTAGTRKKEDHAPLLPEKESLAKKTAAVGQKLWADFLYYLKPVAKGAWVAGPILGVSLFLLLVDFAIDQRVMPRTIIGQEAMGFLPLPEADTRLHQAINIYLQTPITFI